MVPSCQILFSIQTVYNHTYNREYIPARHAVWARNAGLESLMTSSGNHPLTWASSLLPLHAHPHPRWHPQSPFQASRGSQPAQWERRRCLAWGGGGRPMTQSQRGSAAWGWWLLRETCAPFPPMFPDLGSRCWDSSCLFCHYMQPLKAGKS